MTAEIRIDGSHDFIDASERARQEQIGPIVLEAYYGQLCTDLRADIFQTLHTQGALENGNGWAVFDLQDQNDKYSTLADGGKDILVRSVLDIVDSESKTLVLPVVHIVTNEHIRGLTGQESYMTLDFTLDGVNDTQYRVDGVWLNHEEVEGREVTRHGVLFDYDADESTLTILNRPHNYFTPRSNIMYAGNLTTPFGTYRCLEDKIHALGVARSILDEVIGFEPVCSSQPTN